jgi:hypothetical protein
MRFEVGDRVQYRGNVSTVRRILMPKSYEVAFDDGQQLLIHDEDQELTAA